MGKSFIHKSKFNCNCFTKYSSINEKNKFGSIVHISSVDALSGDDKPQDAYGSFKAALLRLSKSISIQYASKNIRSNSILPGPIETTNAKKMEKIQKQKKIYLKSYPCKELVSLLI